VFESEVIERQALADLHRAASPEVVEALGLRTVTVAGGLVSIAGRLPETAAVINRTLGLGTGEALSRSALSEVVAAYRDAGVRRYLVQVHATDRNEALRTRLAEAGLEPGRAWQKFVRAADPIDEPATDLVVREVGAEHGEAFGRIAGAGFDLGERVVPWLAALAGRDGWHVFMSFENDVPAGAGTLFVRDGHAWMDFAATLPQFRRRGSQGALLARRVTKALQLGCRTMFTCTGVAVAGDPQHSYKNILRAGFREDVVRENYVPRRAG